MSTTNRRLRVIRGGRADGDVATPRKPSTRKTRFESAPVRLGGITAALDDLAALLDQKAAEARAEAAAADDGGTPEE